MHRCTSLVGRGNRRGPETQAGPPETRYRLRTSPDGFRSQTFTVLSRLPEYNRRPSGLNARLLIRPVWPRKLRTGSPVRLSQTFTVLSSPPEATHRPSSSRLNATVYTSPLYTSPLCLRKV